MENFMKKLQPLQQSDIKWVIDFLNTKIEPIFSAVLNDEEKKELSIFYDFKYFEKNLLDWKKFYVYINRWVVCWFLSYKNKDPITTYLEHFYIHPDMQNKWLWTSLIEEFEEYCRTNGIKYILTETYYKYDWAINFYKKVNYQSLNNINLIDSYFSRFYKNLVEKSLMFYKIL